MELGRDLSDKWKVLLGTALVGMLLFFGLGLKLNRLPLRMDVPYVVSQRYVVEKTNGVGMVSEREVSRGMSRESALSIVRRDLTGALGSAQFDVRSPEDGVIEVIAGASSAEEARAAEQTMAKAMDTLLYYYELQGDSFELKAAGDAQVTEGRFLGLQLFWPRLCGFAVLGAIVGTLLGAGIVLLRKAHHQYMSSTSDAPIILSADKNETESQEQPC